MDNHSGPHETDVSHSGSFLAALRIVRDIINWLASVIVPTQQDLREAGVDLGELRR